MLHVPFGRYEGNTIEEPKRFALLNSDEDKKQALVVFAALVQNAGVEFIEVEGPSSDGEGWILTGYGTGTPPTISQMTKIKDDCNSRVLVNIWWDASRKSKSSYEGWSLTGAIVAVIQKHNHGDIESSFKGSRYEKILKTRAQSLPLSKKKKPKKDKHRVEKIMENRGLLAKAVDALLGITREDYEKTITTKSSSGSRRHEESSEEDSDTDDDRGRRHRSSSSSSSSSSLRTLPRNLD